MRNLEMAVPTFFTVSQHYKGIIDFVHVLRSRPSRATVCLDEPWQEDSPAERAFDWRQMLPPLLQSDNPIFRDGGVCTALRLISPSGELARLGLFLSGHVSV